MENLNVLIYNELYNGGYSVYILNFITILAIFAAISVIITKNPIVSVLFLIGLFVTMAIYLVLIGFGFLGLSYLLVYVGAVSILFLFILMLINVRISELVSDTKNSIPLVFVTAICFNLPVSDYTSNNLSIINTDNNILNVLSSVFKDNTIYIVYSQS
jgi:NADH-ubiquinone oxidoreductase chain 6